MHKSEHGKRKLALDRCAWRTRNSIVYIYAWGSKMKREKKIKQRHQLFFFRPVRTCLNTHWWMCIHKSCLTSCSSTFLQYSTYSLLLPYRGYFCDSGLGVGTIIALFVAFHAIKVGQGKENIPRYIHPSVTSQRRQAMRGGTRSSEWPQINPCHSHGYGLHNSKKWRRMEKEGRAARTYVIVERKEKSIWEERRRRRWSYSYVWTSIYTRYYLILLFGTTTNFLCLL